MKVFHLVAAKLKLLSFCCLVKYSFQQDADESVSDFINVLRSGARGYDVQSEMNKTTVEGSEVILPCTVDAGEGAAVVWMDENDIVLFYNDMRVIDDGRFNLMNAGKTWNLRIRDTNKRDAGRYRCVTNTDPIRLKYYDLIVYQPAKIDVTSSSQDIVIDEGASVDLICNVTGFPEPKVTWAVHGMSDSSAQREKVPESGRVLRIHKVARFCDNIYYCTASNGFGPPDEHRIRVQVRFKPEVQLANKRLSQSPGKFVVLTCIIKANPLSTTYWAKDSIMLKDKENKFKYEVFDYANGWKREMALTIYNINSNDYGSYKCTARNSLGRDEKYMTLTGLQDSMENTSPPSRTAPQSDTSPYSTKTSSPDTRQSPKRKPPSLEVSNGVMKDFRLFPTFHTITISVVLLYM